MHQQPNAPIPYCLGTRGPQSSALGTSAAARSLWMPMWSHCELRKLHMCLSLATKCLASLVPQKSVHESSQPFNYDISHLLSSSFTILALPNVTSSHQYLANWRDRWLAASFWWESDVCLSPIRHLILSYEGQIMDGMDKLYDGHVRTKTPTTNININLGFVFLSSTHVGHL